MRFQDRSVPVELADVKFCPRKLRPDGPNCKRYMATGPLVGYMIACPSCQFITLHDHKEVGFQEQDGKLLNAANPITCVACGRKIRIAQGILSARKD